jgi:hypothetical protein
MLEINAVAQTKSGVESYHSLSRTESYVWMPVLNYTNKHGFYGEARYNYEQLQTGSLYAGKNFSGAKKINYSVTPMLGVVFGKYNGGSAALNVDFEYEKIFFSAQLQYTVNKENKEENFFYNWSELGSKIGNKFYGGISMQQTKLYADKMSADMGLLLGFETGKITIPVYLFNPFSEKRNLVLGLIIEWGD